ncbi:hypothetical protein [Actinoplanes sp. HUAS TT8]|uniref:hypothetical protein n=1 Tax=Actinoplanes sp. HUAS TT8 TaxID=3447453 RepID=UPI003F521FB1
MSSRSKADLDALVAEAIVDCDDEHDQLSGLFVMIEDNLAVPFGTEVLDVPVVVRKVDLRSSGIVAGCGRRSGFWTFRCRIPRRTVRSGSRRTGGGRLTGE